MSSISSKSPSGQTKEKTYLQYREFQQEDQDYLKILLNQLSVLISTLSEENIEINYKEIRFILSKNISIPKIFDFYIEKVINIVRLDFLDKGNKLSLIGTLLNKEIEFVCQNVDKIERLVYHLTKIVFKDKLVSVFDFIEKLDCNIIFAFIIVIKFEQFNFDTSRSFIQNNLSKFLNKIRSYNSVGFFNLFFFLNTIFESKLFSFCDKLITIEFLRFFDLKIDIEIPFFKTIRNMSLKESLSEIDSESFFKDKLLCILLKFNPNEIDCQIGKLLSEILIPTSQDLPFYITQSNSVEESFSKGVQLRYCFSSLCLNSNYFINWNQIFLYVKENLCNSNLKNSQPTLKSVVQLLAILDFQHGIIDIFLTQNWWFNKNLLFILHNMSGYQNIYDLTALKNITLCFEDDNTDSLYHKLPSKPKKTILKFINIAKLELEILISFQQKQTTQTNNQDNKINNYLKQVFEYDYYFYPEYLIIPAIFLLDKMPAVNKIVDSLFKLLMENNLPQFINVQKKTIEYDQNILFNKFIQFYSNEKTYENINKILFHLSNLNLLDDFFKILWILDVKIAFKFLIESSFYNYDFKSVFEAKMNDLQKNQLYIQVLIEVLFERVQKDYDRDQKTVDNQSNHLVSFSKILELPFVYYLLERLKQNNAFTNSDSLKNLQLLILTTYPRLINYGNVVDDVILKNSKGSNFFSSKIEQEMKSYYSKMYNKEIEISELVNMLIEMKYNKDPHKQDVFACMIYSLLDEYRFFSDYPLSALASTSLLFGALLENDLIQGTTLTVALNFIWESCNQHQDSHLFKFAIQSLYNFRSKLHEYPIYCKHLLDCPSLASHEIMYQIVKDAAAGIPCTKQTVNSILEIAENYQSILIDEYYISNQLQNDVPEVVSDKILFYINNLTFENLKHVEIKKLLNKKYYYWFFNYITERAKSEANNHSLYSEFINQLEIPNFYNYILNLSLKKIKILLNTIKDSTLKLSHLKNLGSWIGRNLLVNNIPLKRTSISLKYLLVEGYTFKSLHLIIPFVCKILEQAQYSKVFKLPNPWTLGVLSVLVELYKVVDLKLNLRFEIELLFNSLDSKIEDVESSKIIKNLDNNPVVSADVFGITSETENLTNNILQLSLDNEKLPDFPDSYSQSQNQSQQSSNQYQSNDNQLLGLLKLNERFNNLIGNTIFIQNTNLRKIFQTALTKTVRECAYPILTRVSEAVLKTTEVLIAKDFATEKNVQIFQSCYQNLAQKLSSSIVFCIGRKFLVETIESSMIQLLNNNINKLLLSELNSAIQSNVGLCVDIIENFVSENINELIHQKMKSYIIDREKSDINALYFDKNSSEYALKLPGPLKLHVDGVTPNQIKIYENFGSYTPMIQTNNYDHSEMMPDSQLKILQEDVIEFEQLFAAIIQNCEKSIQILSDFKDKKLSDLSPIHPVMLVLTQALTIAQNNSLKYPELLLKFAQYVVNCLFTQFYENQLCNKIYVIILDKLCEFSPGIARDVIWWLTYSFDKRKFNVQVIFSLLKINLIDPIKLDSSIYKLITESKSSFVVKFSAILLYNIFDLENSQPTILRSEFALTLKVLSEYTFDESSEESFQAKTACSDLFDLLNVPLSTNVQLYDQLSYVYSEWVKLMFHSEKLEYLQNQFILNLYNADILADPEYFHVFFKAAIEISISSFSIDHEMITRLQHESYLTVDKLGMLIIKIIVNFENEDDAIEYFKKILSIVLVVFIENYQNNKSDWNQRAYFRFFSSLFSLWCDEYIFNEIESSTFESNIYLCLSELLILLQPSLFPDFTFAWISLVSHRMFLPKLLEMSSKENYNTLLKLLTSFFKFIHICSKDVNHIMVSFLFKSINRIIIGILHDYPDFLVETHYQLINAIPSGYIQMKNIVLSATPSNIIVPDPFTQDLKIDKIPEINNSPNIFYNPAEDLSLVGIKKNIDLYFKSPSSSLAKSIYNALKLDSPEKLYDFRLDLVNYNQSLINALVFYLVIVAVSDKDKDKDKSSSNFKCFIQKSNQLKLLLDLLSIGSTEFKFHLINSIANHLRYPNNHSHFFIGVILYFFSSNSIWSSPTSKSLVQEIITRVLLERRLVNNPHPWGLTFVFTELIKNDEYAFFSLPFVKNSDPNLKNMFYSLQINVQGSVLSNEI